MRLNMIEASTLVVEPRPIRMVTPWPFAGSLPEIKPLVSSFCLAILRACSCSLAADFSELSWLFNWVLRCSRFKICVFDSFSSLTSSLSSIVSYVDLVLLIWLM